MSGIGVKRGSFGAEVPRREVEVEPPGAVAHFSGQRGHERVLRGGPAGSTAARCALHLTVDGGLITRYHVYEDSLTVARAFTG